MKAKAIYFNEKVAKRSVDRAAMKEPKTAINPATRKIPEIVLNKGWLSSPESSLQNQVAKGSKNRKSLNLMGPSMEHRGFLTG